MEVGIEDDSFNRKSVREELQDYVDSIQRKIGSGSESLIIAPSNFEEIAQSMSRADLHSVDAQPWTKYLLSASFDKQLDQEFDGRYRGVANDTNEQIKQGLARISLLDRQISSIERKSGSGAHSENKNNSDQTFLTKAIGVREGKSGNLDTEIQEGRVGESSDSIIEGQKCGTAASDADANASVNRDSARLIELLRMDDDEFDLHALHYTKTREYADLCADVDSRISLYGRLDRLHIAGVEHSTITHSIASHLPETELPSTILTVAQRVEARKQSDDYLKEQRAAREAAAAELKIDRMLKSLKEKRDDCVPIFEPAEGLRKQKDDSELESYSRRMELGSVRRILSRSNLLEVPLYDNEMIIHDSVTRMDIMQLVAEASEALFKERMSISGGEEGGHVCAVRDSSEFKDRLLAKREEVEQLLHEFKGEIARLSLHRSGEAAPSEFAESAAESSDQRKRLRPDAEDACGSLRSSLSAGGARGPRSASPLDCDPASLQHGLELELELGQGKVSSLRSEVNSRRLAADVSMRVRVMRPGRGVSGPSLRSSSSREDRIGGDSNCSDAVFSRVHAGLTERVRRNVEAESVEELAADNDGLVSPAIGDSSALGSSGLEYHRGAKSKPPRSSRSRLRAGDDV